MREGELHGLLDYVAREEELRRLLDEIATIYNSRGMPGFYKFFRGYEGNGENREFLDHVKWYLEKCSGSHDTLLLSIWPRTREDIMTSFLERYPIETI